MTDNPMTPHPENCEIVSSRVVAAPRELVFRAWTDPVHLAQWWGPQGFTNTFHEFDLRPGGNWRFVMHGPDGTDYENQSRFVEISKPERLVFDHLSQHYFRVITTFTEQAGGTRVTFRLRFNDATECARVRVFAADANEQNLDRLEAELARMASRSTADTEKRRILMQDRPGATGVPADHVLTLTHEFAAPRELVWRAYTEAEHLAHWWGPKGFAMVSTKLDLRPGGAFHYHMRSSEGYEMWGKMVYREIVPPERLVYITGFSDPSGNFTRHPMAADWPLQMLSVMTLTESAGKTRLTMTVEPLEATPAEIKVFKAGFDSMRQGFGSSLAQLDIYLADQLGARS